MATVNVTLLAPSNSFGFTRASASVVKGDKRNTTWCNVSCPCGYKLTDSLLTVLGDLRRNQLGLWLEEDCRNWHLACTLRPQSLWYNRTGRLVVKHQVTSANLNRISIPAFTRSRASRQIGTRASWLASRLASSFMHVESWHSSCQECLASSWCLWRDH